MVCRMEREGDSTTRRRHLLHLKGPLTPLCALRLTACTTTVSMHPTSGSIQAEFMHPNLPLPQRAVYPLACRAERTRATNA